MRGMGLGLGLQRRDAYDPGGPSSRLWLPTDATSATLLYWWDFSDLSTIVLNGATIASITDKKSGIVASQATAGLQPSWSLSPNFGTTGVGSVGINSQKRLVTPAVPSRSAGQIFSFTRYAGNNGQDHHQYNRIGATIYNWSCIREQAVRRAKLQVTDSGGLKSVNGTVNSTSSPSINRYSWDTTPQIKARAIEAAAQEAEGTTALASNVSSDAGVAPITFGADPNNLGKNMGGDWSAVVQFAGVLSAAESDRMEGWMAWSRNLASILPAAHPYKSAAPTFP